ncbi:U1 small nuclear ribonucleoprotein 70 kDa [Trapelia coarctata]|nr:U1 small nuclear ribonucleoprotein 70 kDa [Trapelia coarctata]
MNNNPFAYPSGPQPPAHKSSLLSRVMNAISTHFRDARDYYRAEIEKGHRRRARAQKERERAEARKEHRREREEHRVERELRKLEKEQRRHEKAQREGMDGVREGGGRGEHGSGEGNGGGGGDRGTRDGTGKKRRHHHRRHRGQDQRISTLAGKAIMPREATAAGLNDEALSSIGEEAEPHTQGLSEDTTNKENAALADAPNHGEDFEGSGGRK